MCEERRALFQVIKLWTSRNIIELTCNSDSLYSSKDETYMNAPIAAIILCISIRHFKRDRQTTDIYAVFRRASKYVGNCSTYHAGSCPEIWEFAPQIQLYHQEKCRIEDIPISTDKEEDLRSGPLLSPDTSYLIRKGNERFMIDQT